MAAEALCFHLALHDKRLTRSRVGNMRLKLWLASSGGRDLLLKGCRSGLGDSPARCFLLLFYFILFFTRGGCGLICGLVLKHSESLGNGLTSP